MTVADIYSGSHVLDSITLSIHLSTRLDRRGSLELLSERLLDERQLALAEQFDLGRQRLPRLGVQRAALDVGEVLAGVARLGQAADARAAGWAENLVGFVAGVALRGVGAVEAVNSSRSGLSACARCDYNEWIGVQGRLGDAVGDCEGRTRRSLALVAAAKWIQSDLGNNVGRKDAYWQTMEKA